MSQGQSGTPVLILKEGTSENKGRDAQRNNIFAAKLIAEIVKSSLGPRGMDKMLVDTLGDVTITNDGATILKEIDVQHPAAKMIVEISKTTDNEVGDGTTSAVVLAGALLENAEDLIRRMYILQLLWMVTERQPPRVCKSWTRLQFRYRRQIENGS